MVIGDVALWEKTGGRSGTYRPVATLVLLVLLAIVWAGVGVYWLRTRGSSTPSLSIGSYSRRLSVLNPSQSRAQVLPLRGGSGVGGGLSPMASLGPARQFGAGTVRTGRSVSSEQARLRRRNVLVGLVGFSVVTLVAAVMVRSTPMILLHLIADALLLGFVLLLVQYQRAIELERTMSRPVYAAPPQRRLASTGTDDAVGVGADVFAR
jgi:hypothetical protein